MGKLIYLMNVSLDGYIETPDHSLDWAVADEEVFGWFIGHMRAVDASLYGRRIYETVFVVVLASVVVQGSTIPLAARRFGVEARS